MVQHLSIPLLLSDDALGASKDTPVSGSICRELKAVFLQFYCCWMRLDLQICLENVSLCVLTWAD